MAEAGRWACRPCEDVTSQRLAELPGLFRQLDTTATLMRGTQRTGGFTSGSKTPPIPPRLEVLDLVAPGGAAARLQAIEDSWRQTLGRGLEPVTDGQRIYPAWRAVPANVVPGIAQFLRINLQWACERYESVGQDIDELRKLHAEMTALAAGDRRPGRVNIGICPTLTEDGWCGQQLTAATNSHRVHCGACGARWDGLGEWRELRAAQEAVDAEQAQQMGAVA
ncbi:hypothetical protein OG352_06355 [Streptomyces sp. NBC_01485]|uniref:hypothetical protein n=1 Tax=Streptomyces sp. NBC_01485 TaxID=2903884 RepID=UPI002E363A23|nr:hypothetical protein [Streptomyces sp. NBC_01485]